MVHNMIKIILKVAVGFTTFIVGIAVAGVWFFASFSLINNLEVAPPARIETEIDEQYIIYSALIKELFLKRTESPLVIANQTSFYDRADYVKEITAERRFLNAKQRFTSVSEETLLDFEQKQAQPAKLSAKFDLPVEYTLIDTKDPKQSKALMIRLSQVGFNHDRTQAFIEIEYFCGPLCGFGRHILLEKENRVWKIKEEFDGWVS